MPPKRTPDQLVSAFQESIRTRDMNALRQIRVELGIATPPLSPPLVLKDMPPLHAAIASGKIDSVRTVLAEGADVNEIFDSLSPLCCAIIGKNTEIVRLLLEQPGIKLDVINSEGDNVFHYALVPAPELFELFLEYHMKGLDFNVNNPNHQGIVALNLAIDYGNTLSAKTLLKFHNIDVNGKEGMESPLHIAASRRNLEILKVLLAHSEIKIDCLDNYNHTPLYRAMVKGDVQAVSLLLENGADIHHKNLNGNNMLHGAALGGDLTLINLVLSKPGFNIDCANIDGNTPLHLAAVQAGAFAFAALMRSKGLTNHNTPSGSGDTPFILAAKHNNEEVLKMLLTSSKTVVNINWSNNQGFTALHFIAQNGNADMAKLLLCNSEIDPYIKNCNGKTALDLAASSNQFGTFQVLLTAMATDFFALNDIIHNPNIDKKIKEEAKEKLIQLEVLGVKALDGSLDISHEILPDLAQCWKDFSSSDYRELEKIICPPTVHGVTAKQLIVQANKVLNSVHESYKLPHILLFAMHLKATSVREGELLIHNTLHKMHQAYRGYYPEYQDAIVEITKIGKGIYNLKKAVAELQATHFIYKQHKEAGMHNSETTLTQLWDEMGRNKFNVISKILGLPEAESLYALKETAMSNINIIDPKHLPETLLFSMFLKSLGFPATDEIIKQVIIKMTEVNVRKTEDGKILHTKYKAAIDEILENTPAKELLTEAVNQIEKEVRYEFNMTLLHKASFELRSEIIKLLGAGKIDINRLDDDGWCALTCVMNARTSTPEEKIEAVNAILAYYPNLYAGSESLDQPIACAVTHPEVQGSLIDYAHKQQITPGEKPLTQGMWTVAGWICNENPSQYNNIQDYYNQMGHDSSHLSDYFWNAM